jgi:hypothetical protein
MAAYARTHDAMFVDDDADSGCPTPAQRLHFAAGGQYCMLAVAGPEYVAYLAFDALTDQSAALGACHRLCAWVKGRQADLFVPL